MAKAFALLEQKVLHTLRSSRLISEGDSVLVGVSGGPDSMALLNALAALSPVLGIKVSVCHLNHMLRPEAEDDQAFVAKAASGLGLELIAEVADVREASRTLRTSVEDAARIQRYDFFVRAAQASGANRVATGHTADDQVETLIMRLLRGAGLDGLTGIPQSRPLAKGIDVIRPLLDISRGEVLDYCAQRQIAFLNDPSNQSPEFTRNRVRNEALPILDAIAPGWRDRALESMRLLGEDAALLSALAEEALAQVAAFSGEGEGAEAVVDLDGFGALDQALKGRVIRRLCERLGELAGFDGRLGGERVRALLNRLRAPGNFHLQLGRGMVAEREYSRLTISRPTPKAAHPQGPGPSLSEFEALLFVPGAVSCGPHGVTLRAEIMPAEAVKMPEVGQWATKDHALLDFDRITEPLLVRSARPGDRFQPLGMDGTKKLQDYFVDEKVPKSVRERALVVESQEVIVWVAGHRVSSVAKITDLTRLVLHLWLERTSGSGRQDS